LNLKINTSELTMSVSTITPTVTRPRDVQVAELGINTKIFRSRTWERLKFEVEYALAKGTTANSYLISGEQTALIDPPGESFSQIFLEELEKHHDLSKLDYLILGHVNPNRMATLSILLAKAPQVRIICSKPGANALKCAFSDWENKIQSVRSEDTLDLGQGHQLQFLFIPTPRWADGLCTYDSQTRNLYSDKLFGVHVCDDMLFDENWKQLDEDRHYYFDCLHAAQTKQVEAVLDKLEKFPAKYYAPSHGPVVRYSLSRLTYDYRQWCQQRRTQDFKVALLYASAYGNTTTLANAIAQGLIDNGVTTELINCELSEPEEIAKAVEDCDGFIIGSPTLGGHAPVQIETALGVVLSSAGKTKLVGVFGSYGWSGEAIDLIEGKLQDGNYPFGFETIRVRFTPDESALKKCQQAGTEFAQNLKKTKKQRMPRQGLTEAQIDRTEQAVGRIVGSLCVLTVQQQGQHQGFLTSWVSQATFSPPGLMIAISKQQAEFNCLELESYFVLNVLKEGRNIRRHFSFQNQLENNPFDEIMTQPAANGCLIITEALAYLECQVQQRLDLGDCWLIYAIVQVGNVLETLGMTAIHHRKSGRQF
jgi:flavorubredoxin/flavin reductase (DIM6/NTAB) family NADH-FMN oxidoreductase RutF